MHPAEISAAIKIAGFTQTDIAQSCGTACTIVSQVIAGRSRSKQIEMRIAAATGKPLGELWPQWYGPDGVAIKKPRKRISDSERAARLKRLERLANEFDMARAS